MKKKDTEIYRIQVFLDAFRSIRPDLKNLLEPSHKYYQEKLRDLMVREGKNPHPYPNERIDYV